VHYTHQSAVPEKIGLGVQNIFQVPEVQSVKKFYTLKKVSNISTFNSAHCVYVPQDSAQCRVIVSASSIKWLHFITDDSFLCGHELNSCTSFV